MEKNIKIKKEGAFYVPGYENFKSAGILYIYDDNSIELDLWGTPDDKKVLGQNTPSHLSTIIGYTIPDNDHIILKNCLCPIFRGFSSGRNRTRRDNNVAKSKWYIELMLEGVSFEEYEHFKFNNFIFKVEYSGDYFYNRGFMVSPGIEKEGSKLIADLKTMICDNIQVNLTDDIILDILFDEGQAVSMNFSEITIQLDPTFRLSSKSQKGYDFDFFIELAQKIRLFLSFSSKMPMNITEISFLKQKDVNNIIDVHYSGFTYIDDFRENYNNKVLSFIPEIFSDVLINWIELYEKLGLILNLFDLVNIGRISLTAERFLILSRCLEGLHRIFYDETPVDRGKFKQAVKILLDEMSKQNFDTGIQDLIENRITRANQMSFRNRILSLINSFFEEMSPKNLSTDEIKQFHAKLSGDIRDSRDYYTHALIDNKKPPPDIHKLGYTTDILMMLMDFHLLKLLSSNNVEEQYLFGNRSLSTRLHRFRDILNGFSSHYYKP